MLRAAAVVACEELMRRAGGRFNIIQLDNFLWLRGKEPGYRSKERHATRDTLFY